MPRASLAQYHNVFPVLAPVDIVATETMTARVDCKNAHELAFLVYFGSLTSASATDNVVVSVEATSADSSTSGSNIPFTYRLGVAAATNPTFGAATAATSATEVSVSIDEDGKSLWIEVSPADVAAAGSAANGRFVGIRIAPCAAMTATPVSVVGLITSRFLAATMQSSS